MSLSYLFLSVSFVFLVLAMDALVKKNTDNIGRFVCISLVANLVSMFSFVFPSRYADTHRGGNGVASHRVGNGAEEDPNDPNAPKYIPSEIVIGATQRREQIHHRMNEDLDAMHEMTTDMLVNLAEIKAYIRCLDPDAFIAQSSDAGLPSLEDAGAGAGVSSETPK